MSEGPARSRSRRWLRQLVVGLVLCATLDQVLQHLVLRGDRFLGRPLAPFDPPLFTEEQRGSVERLRAGAGLGEVEFDADLGWAPRPETGAALFAYDWAGARIAEHPLAREKQPDVRRVAVVGGSFARGDEVAGRETWCARLGAARADLELANLGVGGYGPDQALLRFRRDGLPLEPDEVWLVLVPGRTLRLLTQYWPAMGHWKRSATFKPRFVPVDGEEPRVELVPHPARTSEEAADLIEDQAAFLAAVGEFDAFVRRAPLAYLPRGRHWTHRSGLARLVLSAHEAGARRVGPRLRDPSSELFRTLLGIAIELGRSAGEGVRARVLVLPDRGDLQELVEAGTGAWEAWADAARSHGIEVLDLTPLLIEHGAHDREAWWRPGGHYAPELNQLIADELAKRIERAR